MPIDAATEDLFRLRLDHMIELRHALAVLRRDKRYARTNQSLCWLDALHQWMILNRQKIADGSATAKALDYSRRRWGALTRF